MRTLGFILAALLFAAPAAAETGTASNGCAPWDGAAVDIMLDNNVRVAVFVNVAALRALQSPATYIADDAQEAGKASIADCSGGPCELDFCLRRN